MIPRNRTAKTAHTIRTVELSIALSPFLTITISASLAPSFSRVLEIRHHRYQFAYNPHGDWSHRHDEQRRQNTEKDRENQLHAQLRGLFLSDLPRLNPHEVGMGSKALGDACSKTVRLDQNGHQLFEIVHSSPLG